MMKIAKMVIALTIPLLGVGLTVPTTVNASAWKKGTPKAVRGDWYNKGVQNKHVNIGWTDFSATKHEFGVGHMGMPTVTVYHPFYKHTKNTYFLKGYAKKIGLWPGRNIMYKLVRKGHHFQLKGIKGAFDDVPVYRQSSHK
ncbi:MULTISPECIES: hypothetical protein [Levilactobacillus]|uniref:hypothetical protein n=1 Tax=Levilactobacillus TaxID=2767886 RepID=UPI001950BCE1|nr:hypothetical protein [Levilactobacillus sp. 244-2]